jgi:hypothetical protein
MKNFIVSEHLMGIGWNEGSPTTIVDILKEALTALKAQ